MTTNPPVTVTYTLEDLFTRFERNINEKIDKQSTEVKEQFAEVKEQFAEVKEQFTKVDEKIERQSAEFKQQFTEVNQKLLKLEVGQAELAGEIKAVSEKLSGEIKNVDEKLSGDIKTVNATVAGINKRIDNAEFFNRSVAVTLVAAVFGGLVKWFGWLPTN